MRRRLRRVALAAALAASVVVLVPPSEPADAGSGLRTFNFASSGITLSSSSYRYSNASGLWQTINNSNSCNTIVDGNFGSQTTSTTKQWQAQFGLPQSGVVGAGTWNFVNNSTFAGTNRLSPTGVVDGFATIYYTFYGGVPPAAAHLGWNGFASQWLFNPNAYESSATGWQLIQATANRTIGTVFVC